MGFYNRGLLVPGLDDELSSSRSDGWRARQCSGAPSALAGARAVSARRGFGWRWAAGVCRLWLLGVLL
ncbi:MAG: hypothetical protein ACYCWL_16115, partial [Thauera sp.]